MIKRLFGKKREGGEDNRPTPVLYVLQKITTFPTQPSDHLIQYGQTRSSMPIHFSVPHLIRALDDHRVGAGAGLTGFRVALFSPIVTRVRTFKQPFL